MSSTHLNNPDLYDLAPEAAVALTAFGDAILALGLLARKEDGVSDIDIDKRRRLGRPGVEPQTAGLFSPVSHQGNKEKSYAI